jgi:hypothetical protein
LDTILRIQLKVIIFASSGTAFVERHEGVREDKMICRIEIRKLEDESNMRLRMALLRDISLWGKDYVESLWFVTMQKVPRDYPR